MAETYGLQDSSVYSRILHRGRFMTCGLTVESKAGESGQGCKGADG